MALYTYTKDPIGQFVEKDTGNYFEYSLNDEMVLAPPAHGGRNMEFPHKVWVGGEGVCGMTGWRHAKVGKTVVHIITDEDDYGRAVVEKWYLKSNREYAI
jgi:hypothetical protein